jgi:hypothetical protein
VDELLGVGLPGVELRQDLVGCVAAARSSSGGASTTRTSCSERSVSVWKFSSPSITRKVDGFT